ncbi:hypothetical protein [Larkinella sp. VNQ87]|uniref:hypothetical protein n=1 Tax=Larkinella sp. VNQ87 TaxID=3400921 RepID=UPI003C2C4477
MEVFIVFVVWIVDGLRFCLVYSVRQRLEVVGCQAAGGELLNQNYKAGMRFATAER